MRYFWWWLIVLVWVPLSCSHPFPLASPIKALSDHPRIVYQSLLPSQPVIESCPSFDTSDMATQAVTSAEALEPTSSSQTVSPVPFTKPLFVAFQHEEWHIPPDHADWVAVLQRLDPLEHYLVVGYSHGAEEEQALLAQRRAEYIASLLHKAGFPLNQIHRMASWSPQPEAFAPALGVQIFSFGSKATEIRFGITDKIQTPSFY